MKAKLVSKDQDFDKEQTVYWFEITKRGHGIAEVGERFGVIQNAESFDIIVDSDKKEVSPAMESCLMEELTITDEMINDY